MHGGFSFANASNFTEASNKDVSFELHAMDYVLMSMYSLVFLIGVGGNLMVIRWFYGDAKTNNPGSLLVIVLATNDLIASIMTPLLEMHRIVSRSYHHTWFLGKGLCKTLPAFSALFLLTTPWFLVAIATERFQ